MSGPDGVAEHGDEGQADQARHVGDCQGHSPID
jgi:hypothetical protein